MDIYVYIYRAYISVSPAPMYQNTGCIYTLYVYYIYIYLRIDPLLDTRVFWWASKRFQTPIPTFA